MVTVELQARLIVSFPWGGVSSRAWAWLAPLSAVPLDVGVGATYQAVMFAESRMAPCMGSTLCEEYAGQDAADAAATWVVLKACVAEWELRLRWDRSPWGRHGCCISLLRVEG